MRRAAWLVVLLLLALVGIAETQPSTQGYTTVQDEGTSLTRRRIIDFRGAGVTCADNSATSATRCTITSGGGGSPGGVGGNLQTNDGAGGFGAYAGDSCTNQFPTAIDADGNFTCTSPVLAGAQFANQGTTTTVLHGNAAGNPSFGAVVSNDLNITTTSCTNQFVSAISAGGVGTCTTATLAGAQFANQGTTTTVLHGNAAGNPSFGAVVLTTDVSGALPIANGGTANTTATAAFDALAPTTTQGDIIYHNGTDNVRLAAGTSGHFLKTNGAGANPQWAAASGGSAKYYFVGMSSNNLTVTNLTCYPVGRVACAAASIDTRGMVPASGTIGNLRVFTSVAQDAGDTCAWTVRTGTDPATAPSATTLTCSIVDTAQSCTDVSNTPSVTAGQSIDLHMAETGSCSGQAWWSFELVPS